MLVVMVLQTKILFGRGCDGSANLKLCNLSSLTVVATNLSTE
jgi:hypothetical protein